VLLKNRRLFKPSSPLLQKWRIDFALFKAFLGRRNIDFDFHESRAVIDDGETSKRAGKILAKSR
jgi:hypothetical protein